jgi:hypothetical protein
MSRRRGAAMKEILKHDVFSKTITISDKYFVPQL